MASRKRWRIKTWHGEYELSRGASIGFQGKAPLSSQAKQPTGDHLFFLLCSFVRRDPEVLPVLYNIYESLIGDRHSSAAPRRAEDFTTHDLESIADELRWRARAGLISVVKIDPFKKLHIRPAEPEPESSTIPEAIG